MRSFCNKAGTFIKNFLTINKRMIPSKIACLLNGIMVGCYAVFLNVFFISVGLSKFQAGMIIGVMYIPPILTGPLWGFISDKTKKPKLVLATLCIGACIFVVPMPWIAHSIHPLPNRCNNTLTNSSNTCDEKEAGFVHDQDVISKLFGVLLTLIIIGSMFLVPIQGYIYTLVMNVVKSSKEQVIGKVTFGGQTICQPIGMALGNLIAGAAVDSFVSDMSTYTPVFYILLSAIVPVIPVGFYLIRQDKDKGGTTEVTNDTSPEFQTDVVNTVSLHKQVFQHVINLDVIVFIITVFVCGTGHYVFLNFVYAYVSDTMDITKTKMSYILITANLIEIPMFPCTSMFIKLVRGPIPALIISLFATFVRFLVMSLDVPFYLFVAIQILNAMTSALALASIMQQTHEISPKAINMTMNGIILTVFTPLSSLFVGFVGGKIFELYGGRKLFLGESLLCLIWSLIMFAYYGSKKLRKSFIYDSRRKDQNQPDIDIDGANNFDDMTKLETFF